MANRGGSSNGGYGPENPSPYWNAQAEPEIDVWTPSTSSTNVTSEGQGQKPHWREATTTRYQGVDPNLYAQGDATSNLTGDYNPNASIFTQQMPHFSSQTYSGFQQQSAYVRPEANLGSNLLDPYQFDAGANLVVGDYSSELNIGQPQNFGLYVHPHARDNNWSAPPLRSTYNANPEGSYQAADVNNFKNPFMNKEDSVNDAAGLIRNMHIGSQKAQEQIHNNRKTPMVLSKASMAVLKRDIADAAAAFESPQSLQLARERELGLIDDVGTTVIVSNLSAEAANFIPRAKSPGGQDSVPQQASQEEEKELIANLKSCIEKVLLQPGNFDDLSAILINCVKQFVHSDEIVTEMVQIILSKAIDEDNFKYLGARLCDKLTMPKVLPSFRSIFLKHFQAKFKSIQSLIESKRDEDSEKIHGFLMFMAEIFIHIKINGTPPISLGRSLCKSFEKLIGNPTFANISFVCKSLKLTGAKLLDAFEGNKIDMENYQKVFEILNNFSNNLKDPEDESNKKMISLISSVWHLKNSNWGRTVSNTRQKSSIEDPEKYGEVLSEADQNYYMNEPVFFTPDGVEYTAAEAQIPEFYNQHLAKFDSSLMPWSHQGEHDILDDLVPSDDEVEYYKQDSENPEYDLEFEEFLLESGQLQ